MRKLVLGMALATTALATSADARDGEWYVGLEGGVMLPEDPDYNDGAVEIDSEYGYDFDAIVGYDFGALRLEAEAGYREADVDGINAISIPVPTQGTFTSLGNFDAAGDQNSLSFMVNALLDFGSDEGLQGFAGGGVGVARTNHHASINSNFGQIIDDSDTGFAWQLLAGVRAPLTESIDVGLKYRFYNHPNVELVDALARDVDTRFRSHSLLGSLIYNFGGQPEPVVIPPVIVTPTPTPRVTPTPTPRVTPTPTPVATCNTGPYVVYFDWDKSDLDAAARSTLNEAVSAYRNCGMASVMLAGHTDTSGSRAYNEGLAERRNASVRSYLTSTGGIPGTRITARGFGERDLAVETGDGVREVRNRRVEVTYGPNSGM